MNSWCVTKVSTLRSVRGLLYRFFCLSNCRSARADGVNFAKVFRIRRMPPGTCMCEISGGPNGVSTFQGPSEAKERAFFLCWWVRNRAMVEAEPVRDELDGIRGFMMGGGSRREEREGVAESGVYIRTSFWRGFAGACGALGGGQVRVPVGCRE